MRTPLPCLLLLVFCAVARAAETETIVIVRHGEKPEAGLGQLSCRGLNRALALPQVLARDFGRFDAVFAPDPAVGKEDRGRRYDYVRPLATVEPAAIAFGLPVDASVGFADVAGLRTRLAAPGLRRATVLVGWEHRMATVLARALVGDAGRVPEWRSDDFDAMYVVRVSRPGGATFQRLAEGLNGLSAACPARP